MKTILRVLISLGVVATSTQVLSASLDDSVTGPPPIAIDVHVINDESSPVPVAGDVNATVSGEVDATITNTPLPVTIEGSVFERVPFNKTVDVESFVGPYGGGDIVSYPDDFPDGKSILVVEHVSYNVKTLNPDARLSVVIRAGKPFAEIYMPQVEPHIGDNWSDTQYVYRDSIHLRVYAGNLSGYETEIPCAVCISWDETEDGFWGTASVSGYFISADSPTLSP